MTPSSCLPVSLILTLWVSDPVSHYLSDALYLYPTVPLPAWPSVFLNLRPFIPAFPPAGLRQQDPRLRWQGGPALGRSFLHGPTLDNGQLRVQRDGIYKLHIQVTLANCSSTRTTTPREATLAVGICAPATRRVSLLRLNFYLGCTVASQRLTPLAQGDTLCTNLTVPLQASRNADDTFFGVQWVHSWPPSS
nr:CD70 antigen [Loxodonta africana]